MALSARNSSIAYVNNASSIGFTFPSGSLAGDLCVIFAAHGFSVTTPSGWTQLDNEAGSFVNGAVFYKTLSSGDITTGSVTIGFGGTYYGVVAAVTFVGATAVPQPAWTVYSRNSGSGTTRVLTGYGVTGDYPIYFGMGRGNVTVTSSLGSALQTTSNLNASGVLTGGVLGASGSLASTFTFSSAPSGDYDAIVVFSEVTALQVSQVESAAWAEPASGVDVSVAGVGAWAEPADGIDATKAESGAWLEFNDFRVSQAEVGAWVEKASLRRRALFVS